VAVIVWRTHQASLSYRAIRFADVGAIVIISLLYYTLHIFLRSDARGKGSMAGEKGEGAVSSARGQGMRLGSQALARVLLMLLVSAAKKLRAACAKRPAGRAGAHAQLERVVARDFLTGLRKA